MLAKDWYLTGKEAALPAVTRERFNFPEAMRRLANGDKVRLPFWETGTYLYSMEHGIKIGPEHDLWLPPAGALAAIALSDAWEIYEEPSTAKAPLQKESPSQKELVEEYIAARKFFREQGTCGSYEAMMKAAMAIADNLADE